MSKIISATKIEETALWKELNNRPGTVAKSLAINIIALCEEASNRSKAISTYAPQYTLHDDTHLLRVTELMGLLLGRNKKEMNDIELGLLILSAFFHDQGMIPSDDEIKSIKTSQDFDLFRANWLVDHPNYNETAGQMNFSHCAMDRRLILSEQLSELDAAMLTAYLRRNHGSRSADYVRSTYNMDKRIEVQNVNLADYIARLCESHSLPCYSLVNKKGFRYDEQIGVYSINMPFVAVMLRLADILDFDRDRTPEHLLKSIHFTNSVSLHEWEKHRSVVGWSVSSKLIRFTARCKHPAYEASIREYMVWIDKELIACHEICQTQPRHIKGYTLNLPNHVDCSRIEPLDNAYRYHDLEFSLSRDEVVRLLMTEKLYNGQHLCIRELLQNALDALRYRKTLFEISGTSWQDGTVKFRHFVNGNGYEVLECQDNGSGMDEEIINGYFVKVGRSFYRSPDFERERVRFKMHGKDFDPCSKFGIGFMSCFMLGDRITIKTRRDYGSGREWGSPLIVEIHGLSGLLVVRNGASDQPIGTTVSIVSRQKPSFLDTWTDNVKLCPVLKNYALATEFPIEGRCEIKELSEIVKIPSVPDLAPTLLEVLQVKQSICFEQNLSDVSVNLKGFARESFLIDTNKLPCVANSEAQWLGKTDGSSKKWVVYKIANNQPADHDFIHHSVPVCIDGILVAGTPVRSSYKKSQMSLGERNSNIYSFSPALVDARGDLKPEITPGRTPPDHMGSDMLPGWKRLETEFKKGLGLLWEKVIQYHSNGLSPEVFWKLAFIYKMSVVWIPHKSLWDHLAVSVLKPDGQTNWCLIRDLGELEIHSATGATFVLCRNEGSKIGPNDDLGTWENQGSEHATLNWDMNTVVLLMSSVDIREEKVVLLPVPPVEPRLSLGQYMIDSMLGGVSMFFLNYVSTAKDALVIETPFPTANRNHPLTVVCFNTRYTNVTSDTELQRFAKAFVTCIAESVSTRNPMYSLDKPAYWHKRVAHLYFSVDWDKYESELKAPYKIWTKAKGWYLLGEDDLAQWRDIQLSTDNFG